jgi:hypothetical protein
MNVRSCHLTLSPGMTLGFGMSLSRGMILCLEKMVSAILCGRLG